MAVQRLLGFGQRDIDENDLAKDWVIADGVSKDEHEAALQVNNELADRITSLERELADRERQTHEKVDELSRVIQDQASQIQAMQKEKEATDNVKSAIIAKLAEKLVDESTRKEAYHDIIIDLYPDLIHLTKENRQFLATIIDLYDTMFANLKELDEQASALEAKDASLETQKRGLERKRKLIDVLREQVNVALPKKISDLEFKIHSDENEIETLKASLSARDERIGVIETEVNELNIQKIQLQSRYDVIERERSELTEQIASIAIESNPQSIIDQSSLKILNNLKRTIRRLESEMERLSSQKIALQTECSQKEQQIENSRVEIRGLRYSITQKEATLNIERRQVQALSAANERLKAEIDELSREKNSLTGAFNDILARCALSSGTWMQRLSRGLDNVVNFPIFGLSLDNIQQAVKILYGRQSRFLTPAESGILRSITGNRADVAIRKRAIIAEITDLRERLRTCSDDERGDIESSLQEKQTTLRDIQTRERAFQAFSSDIQTRA
jgi:septal ring factor EnvC (AmiA/AmiB activator)